METPVYEGGLRIRLADPPESVRFATFARYDDPRLK